MLYICQEGRGILEAQYSLACGLTCRVCWIGSLPSDTFLAWGISVCMGYPTTKALMMHVEATMLVIEFEIDTSEHESEHDGYSLGDMTLSGRYGSLTSKGKAPDQSMMIFLSITLLLDGINALLDKHASRRSSEFEFVAIDSSFNFTLREKSGAFIEIRNRPELIDLVPIREFIDALWSASHEFDKRYGKYLKEDNPAFDDWYNALGDFKRVFQIP